VLGNAQIAAVIPVSDIDRAVAFSGGVLGFNVVARRDDLPRTVRRSSPPGEGGLVPSHGV
jgi:catechol 2,3-dioxygenase-like lactoylglutathione lyase family enzyme